MYFPLKQVSNRLKGTYHSGVMYKEEAAESPTVCRAVASVGCSGGSACVAGARLK